MQRICAVQEIGQLDDSILMRLGGELRAKLSEGDASISQDIDRVMRELRRRDDDAVDMLRHVIARLTSTPESDKQRVAQEPVYLAFCRDCITDRKRGYHFACEFVARFANTKIDSGRTLVPRDMTIYDWGGWPQYESVPMHAEMYWNRFGMAVQPQSEPEWVYFFQKVAAFAFCLMIRHRTNRDFWERMQMLPNSRFRTEAEKIVAAL